MATDQVRDALQKLVGGSGVGDAVRQEIRSSWQRSIKSGLSPEKFSVPYESDLDTDDLLMRSARPVLDRLLEDLDGTTAAVLLTDSTGKVEGRWIAQRGLKRRLDNISLAPGFVYDERAVGTNAIGTALAQRGPSLVTGAEHFADVLIPMACAASPIADPSTGRLVGAIDLTCWADEAHGFLLPFARHARRSIEERLADDASRNDKELLQHFLLMRRKAKGPLVLVNERRIFANAAANSLVSPADSAVLWETAQQLPRTDRGGWLQVALDSRVLRVSGEPLFDGGSVLGFVLRLRPSDDTTHLPGSSRTSGGEPLSPTEVGVAGLAIQGLTNREIGERLFMSRFTVDTHLRSIFRKYGVRSRVELTRHLTAAAGS